MVTTPSLEIPFLGILFGGAVATVVSAALVPVALRWARRWRILDRPDSRKHQSVPVPRLGGIAIAGGLAAGLGSAFATGSFAGLGAHGIRCGGVFVLATAIIFGLGLVDDVYHISVSRKFAVQILAAILVVASGHGFTRVSWPFGDPIEVGIWGSIFAVAWIVGITNAVNLIDGLDGLAGGVTAIIAVSLFVFAAIQAEPSSMVVAACLCGTVLGFLPSNWRPEKIYLGDSGSLTLGFVLATLSLTQSLKTSTTLAILVPVLALGVPAIDTLLVMAVRFLRSPERSLLGRIAGMFEADRSHLHHLILAVAFRRRTVVLSLYGLVALFCLSAIVVALGGNSVLAFVVLVVEFLAVVLIRQSSIHARARDVALEKRRKLKGELGIEITHPIHEVAHKTRARERVAAD